MSDVSPGITSLRDHTLADSPAGGGNVEQSEKRITLEQKISLLERKKKQVIGDIAKLEVDYQDTKKKILRDTDIPRLAKRKQVLLQQISALVKSFDVLKGSQDKVIGAFQKFGSERSAELTAIAKSLSLEVTKEMARLSKKAEKLSLWDQFLSDFGEYYNKLAEIVESVSLSQALERAEIQQQVSKANETVNTSKTLKEEAVKILEKAQGKQLAADQRLEDANKIAEFFEKEADVERKKLKEAEKSLKLREEEVKAGKEFLVQKEIDLKKREIRVLDKEKTLQRIVTRLKAQGVTI